MATARHMVTAAHCVGATKAELRKTFAENHSFILPVSIIKKRLAAAGVDASRSQTSLLYDDALNDFFAKRFRAALPKFRKAQRLYPQHPYVASYIGDTKRAIAAGKDRTPKAKA